ncbi:MAG TPA: GldG family protein [Anaerolineales bacterium]|nr:GldG family protein [Anaerolineales bacterium]
MRIQRALAIRIAYVVSLLGLVGAAGWYYYRQTVDRYVYIGLAVALVGVVAGLAFDRERVAQFFRGRQGRYGTNAVVAGLALVGILGVVNVLAYKNPKSWDWTEDSQYSLAPETRATLATLTVPVRLIGFYSADYSSMQDDIRPLLQQYVEAGRGYVTYQFIDPRAEPLQADRYGVTRDGSVVVAMGAGSEVVASPTEQDITGALVRLANPGQRKVYFLTGHGERDMQSTEPDGYGDARQALESKNYEVAALNLLTDPAVPEDALALIIAGPTVPLSTGEIEALRAYLGRGGSVVVMEEPTPGTRMEGVDDPLADELATTWGIRLRNDFVVDLSSSMPNFGIGVTYASDPITARLNNLVSYFPTSRSIEVVDVGNADLTQVELVRTGNNSWGETDFEALKTSGSVEENASADTAGPLTLAATVEDRTTHARLVVFGDVDFAANTDYFQYANGDLLINSIDWAAGQESLISLTPKETTQRFVVPPSNQTTVLIALISVIGIPGAVVVLGVSTFLRRRRQA